MNAEDKVIDAIDQLVDESLAPGPRDDYNADYYDKCTMCTDDWHGLPEGSCPGAWATDEEKALARTLRESVATSPLSTGWVDRVRRGLHGTAMDLNWSNFRPPNYGQWRVRQEMVPRILSGALDLASPDFRMKLFDAAWLELPQGSGYDPGGLGVSLAISHGQHGVQVTLAANPCWEITEPGLEFYIAALTHRSVVVTYFQYHVRVHSGLLSIESDGCPNILFELTG